MSVSCSEKLCPESMWLSHPNMFKYGWVIKTWLSRVCHSMWRLENDVIEIVHAQTSWWVIMSQQKSFSSHFIAPLFRVKYGWVSKTCLVFWETLSRLNYDWVLKTWLCRVLGNFVQDQFGWLIKTCSNMSQRRDSGKFFVSWGLTFCFCIEYNG